MARKVTTSKNDTFEISRVDFVRVRCPFRVESLPTYNLLPVSFVSFRRFLYLLAISLMSTVAWLQKLQGSKRESVLHTHICIVRQSAQKPAGREKRERRRWILRGNDVPSRSVETIPWKPTAVVSREEPTSKLRPTFCNRFKRKA